MVKATVIPEGGGRVADGPPGCVVFVGADPEFETPSGIQFQCPCGCGNVGFLAFDDGRNPHPKWQFDGNREKPTLSPSVFNTGFPCRWHGWLREGEWRSA